MNDSKGKRPVFLIALTSVFLLLLIFLSFPIFTRTTLDYTPLEKDRSIKISMLEPVTPATGDYFIIDITATNETSQEYPYGTASVMWENTGGPGDDSLNKESFRFFVDNTQHRYYVPAGENENWLNSPGIENISIAIPDIEGVDIYIDSIRLKRRTFFALDSFLNRFARSRLGVTSINRYFTPVYIVTLGLIIGFFIFLIGIWNRKKEEKAPVKTRYRNILLISLIAILVLFSFYFIYMEIITTRSYLYAYRDYIEKGDLDKTYLGFYDFEKFIAWLNDNVPEDKNMTVLLTGESIYMMSEMAYNLYPRDIKFINTSQKSDEDIFKEILEVNRENHNNYRYIIVLRDEDRINTDSFVLMNRFKEDSGFIFRLKSY